MRTRIKSKWACPLKHSVGMGWKDAISSEIDTSTTVFFVSGYLCFVYFSTKVGDCFAICFPFCLVSWIAVCASEVLLTFSQILKNDHILSTPPNIFLNFYFYTKEHPHIPTMRILWNDPQTKPLLAWSLRTYHMFESCVTVKATWGEWIIIMIPTQAQWSAAVTKKIPYKVYIEFDTSCHSIKTFLLQNHFS